MEVDAGTNMSNLLVLIHLLHLPRVCLAHLLLKGIRAQLPHHVPGVWILFPRIP